MLGTALSACGWPREYSVASVPVISLSKAKSTQVVTAAGESNAAPGVTEVKRSALRMGTRLEYQGLV